MGDGDVLQGQGRVGWVTRGHYYHKAHANVMTHDHAQHSHTMNTFLDLLRSYFDFKFVRLYLINYFSNYP